MQDTNFWTLNISFRELVAVGVTCIFAWTCTYFAMNVFQDYALGLFIWLPLVMGTTSTLIYGYKRTAEKNSLRKIAYVTLLIFCSGLLCFAWEGVICLFMAAPIGLFFTWIGYRFGYEIIKSKMSSTPTVIVALFISVPFLMAFENANENKGELRSVVTAIEIKATPEEVWKNVIAFPQLKEPQEFIFKTGIAYPINATIQGQGVGAVRHCNFSTGSFVEPITVWDKPQLLKFTVADQPQPMKEISFFDVHPNHLRGYWNSKQGQFKLIKLPNGYTRLEGTTWYENK